ncbi:GntR family transcriptional regulator [Sphingobium sp. AEW010]|nr:GntR family transcriptional regulator [Sphingobium sp. JAI105]MBG6120617.1 DNA-binding GntR family transcriptional regulator [Sphingobium sp. JAI105]TWD06690.1 GntR family transcriptional regulator [Sphingobium sp. AEW010]TWD23623.1 GntR family transcriptional regulator [Sphingobium sp. AEW013]TWD26142.1 GntR family transcriptional regulator [Sphingobium sp. AEW001]
MSRIAEIEPVDQDAAVDVVTVQQRVYSELRTDILLGRIAPGEPLTIRGLAERLGVSAMPIREALRRLAAERAVELLGNRRIRIPVMSPERFDDLLAARIALETEAASRALGYVDDALIAKLVEYNDEVDEGVRIRDYDRWLAGNFAFHRTLYSAQPDSVFVPLIESLWLQIGPFLRQALVYIGPEFTVDRHAEALDAVRARNRMALRIAIEADLRDGITHIGNELMRFNAAAAAKDSKSRKRG